jgi:hypothetical protein
VRTGFNSLGQPSKSLGDGLLRVVFPYPFLQRRRKWQRFADFKSEGLNKSERSLRNLGGLYLERSVQLGWPSAVARRRAALQQVSLKIQRKNSGSRKVHRKRTIGSRSNYTVCHFSL